MVGKEHLGFLYTAITVLTYGGMLVGGPLFASLFRLGMQLGEPWVGLPFFVSGGSFLLALIAISAGEIGKNDEDTGHIADGEDVNGDNEPTSVH